MRGLGLRRPPPHLPLMSGGTPEPVRLAALDPDVTGRLDRSAQADRKTATYLAAALSLGGLLTPDASLTSHLIAVAGAFVTAAVYLLCSRHRHRLMCQLLTTPGTVSRHLTARWAPPTPRLQHAFARPEPARLIVISPQNASRVLMEIPLLPGQGQPLPWADNDEILLVGTPRAGAIVIPILAGRALIPAGRARRPRRTTSGHQSVPVGLARTRLRLRLRVRSAPPCTPRPLSRPNKIFDISVLHDRQPRSFADRRRSAESGPASASTARIEFPTSARKPGWKRGKP